jgi:hypothetical protein
VTRNVYQRDGSVDLVRSSSQCTEHSICIGMITRLAQRNAVKRNSRIGGDDDAVRHHTACRQRFGLRKTQDHLRRSLAVVRRLVHIGGGHVERPTKESKQLAPSRRAGSKKKSSHVKPS